MDESSLFDGAGRDPLLGSPRRRGRTSRTTWVVLALVLVVLLLAVAGVARLSDDSSADSTAVTAILYVVDVSGSDGVESERRLQIDRAARIGEFAISRKIPFIVMIVGGNAADAEVLMRVRADKLRCDGTDECEQVNRTARASFRRDIANKLSLEEVPRRTGSPVGEAHADASRNARLVGGPGAVIVWDSDMEQATLGPNGEQEPTEEEAIPGTEKRRVWLEKVQSYTPEQAAADATTILAATPANLEGMHSLYLGVANRDMSSPSNYPQEDGPQGEAEGRPLNRTALWSFAHALCTRTEAESCIPVIDIGEVIAFIENLDNGS
ncbi:MAG TPA: hypothetical protein VEW93_12050 [Acidimicrobiales bacterium]|nr:hypothetical protein [Acidimicrobiales bacterium]